MNKFSIFSLSLILMAAILSHSMAAVCIDDSGIPANQGQMTGLFSPELYQASAFLDTPEFPTPFHMNGYVLPSGLLMGAIINPSTGQAWFVSGNWGSNWFGAVIVEPGTFEVVGYMQGTFDASRQLMNSHWYIFDCYVSPTP